MTSVSRRGFLVSASASTLMGEAGVRAAKLDRLSIDALQVDNAVDPMGVHTAKARLSWQMQSERRDTVQRSYRVRVADTHEMVSAGHANLWDSGVVTDRRSIDVHYDGRPLASRQRCFWTVEIDDNHGRRAVSPVASWEMGLLEPSDWTGGWVAAETDLMRNDREAGLPWLVGKPADELVKQERSYRLRFNLPESARILIFVTATNEASAVLDGRDLRLPPRDPVAFGPPPPYRVETNVLAGPHVLAVHVGIKEINNPGVPGPRAAILVRAQLESGRIIYVKGERARTVLGRPQGWEELGLNDRTWPMARVLGGEHAAFPGDGAFLLRRTFELRSNVVSARLYMTALGSYVPMLNGARVGKRMVTPEWTDFRQHALYRVYDVFSALKRGPNVLAAVIGDGWYGSYTAPSGRFGFGPPPLRLRAQLEIDYADGTRETIASDDRWQVSRAEITASEIYDGEDVDARLEQPGWSDVAFVPDPARWVSASAVTTPPIALLGATLPPIAPSNVLKPVSIKAVPGGAVVIDFGQNFAGWLRLHAKAPSGTRVILRFAELLKENGAVDQSNLRAARAADTFVMRGDAAGEVLEPLFTYHGFRYVQVEGLPTTPAMADIDGIAVHSALAETGELTLSHHVPQRLWQNGLWSQRSNFFGTPTDCPQRDERLGWTGDAHVFWDAACFNMDTSGFTRKFMLDMRDAQRADGSFPDFAPNNAIDTFTKPGSSPGWADAGIFLPWISWQRYGDTAIIDEHWAAMARYLTSLRTANPDLLWERRRGNDYGDWLSLDGKEPGDPTTPKALVGTAMWKGAASAMAEMAAATGRRDDERLYRTLADDVASAFNRAYVRMDGSVGNGSQTGYILALHFDILPAALRATAAERLAADIVRRGKLLSTGFLGTPYSLDVLADAGHSQLVYDLLLRTAFPSWGYMIAHNATTVWERWNGDVGDRSMNSFNHYALGAVAGFMFRRIAGIDALEPGFTRFRFDPIYDSRMPKAAGRFQSSVGAISTNWQRSVDSLVVDIDIPANSRCELHLPAKTPGQVQESGRALSLAGILVMRATDDGIVLDVGSGRYSFSVKNLPRG